MKKHDLLLSTSNHVTWNASTDVEGLQYEGIVLLLLMAAPRQVYPKMVSEFVDEYVCGKPTKELSAGWNDYYHVCGRKYESIIPQRRATTTKAKQLGLIVPTSTSSSTFFADLPGKKDVSLR